MRVIVWLASYPGSGNTWLRVFLTNLLRKSATPANINQLTEIPHAASRRLFDEHADVMGSDLAPSEVLELRPAVYEAVGAEAQAPLFMKIHDAWCRTPSGEPLTSTRATRGAVYAVRNPLDVAVSYAHHRGASIDETIAAMADPSWALDDQTDGIGFLLPQKMGTWSQHVLSWLDAPGLPVHLVRYEELKRTPVEAFGAVAAFAGLDESLDAVRKAVAFSAFDRLREQEEAHGFSGGSRRAERFFRRGEAGGWQDELTSSQVRRIVDDHGPVMERLGYLDDHGNPVA